MTLKPIRIVSSGQLYVDDDDGGLAIAAAVAAHAALTEGVHGLNRDWLTRHLTRGLTFAGLTANAGLFHEDFVEISRWVKKAGAATFFPVVAGGVPAVATLTAAAGVTETYGLGNATYNDVAICEGHGRWYMAMRCQASNGAGANPPADGIAQLGAAGAAGHRVRFGYDGNVDAAHYSATIWDGAAAEEHLISTVGVDWHFWRNLELWCDGAKYYFSADEETPVELTPVNPPTNPLWARLDVIGGAAVQVVGGFTRALLLFPSVA